MDSKGFSEAFTRADQKKVMGFAEDIINGMVRDSLTTAAFCGGSRADLSWCFQRKESMILRRKPVS